MLARSGSGAHALVQHEDVVHVGVHRGVGTFYRLDALSTMWLFHLAPKETNSSHERKAAGLVYDSRARISSTARRAWTRPEQESGTFVCVRLRLLSLHEEQAGPRLADLSPIDEGVVRTVNLQQGSRVVVHNKRRRA
jgi:hypothetical protein